MRLLATALALALLPPASAQSVETLLLDRTLSFDGIYVDASGTLYAAGGFQGDTVFRIGADGGVDTLATGIAGPIDLFRAEDGAYYTTDFNQAEVSRIGPAGDVSVFADVAEGPADIVADASGNLYVTQYGDPNGFGDGDSVTRVSPDGTSEPYASGGSLAAPVGLDIDPEGNLYVANLFDGRVTRIAPDGSQTLVASLSPTGPFTIGHGVWANGRYYVTYVGGRQVLAIEPDGTVEVVAGTGAFGQADGPAAAATFRNPNGIAASVTGDTLFVGEIVQGGTDRIRMITGVRAVASEPDPDGRVPLRFVGAAPNPFASATRLTFDLPEAGTVSLVAYDVLGREVERLIDGATAAGRHEVDWEPAALSPGAYVLRLTSEHGRATRVVRRSR